MAIPSKQIGWSVVSNLLWQIAKQIERLTKVAAKVNQYINTLVPTVWSEEYWLNVYNSYTRPADWLPISNLVVDGDQKVVMLHAIFQDSNFCALQCAANYTVDWGDGVVENFAANVSAYHVFSYSSFPGTESTLGYRQAIVTVTPQAGQNLTKVDLSINHNQSNLGTTYSSGWLDIKISGSFISTLSLFRPTFYLEVFDFIGTNLVTSAASLFELSINIQHVISFDTASVTDMSRMFYNCGQLETIPFLNTALVTDMSSMFTNSYNLKTIPFLDTSNVINMVSMFGNCYNLQIIPLFNTSLVTNTNTMFSGCQDIETVPFLDTSKVTSMNNMFSSCTSLKIVPLFNTSEVTNMVSMFAGCRSLETVPLFDTAKVTNMGSMFSTCIKIKTIPLFNTISVTDISSMFMNCASLLIVPLLNTSKVINMASMFRFCTITNVPAFNTPLVTSYGNTFQSSNLNNILISPIISTLSVGQNKLSKSALEIMFNNLGNNLTQTITVTNNWGADTAISKTLCGTTTGSTTVTQVNTSSLVAGMLVTGTGINTARAVTFTDAGDLVNLNSHGLVDGNIVSFTTIVTTTGITIRTPYYVVNKTTNDFKVALTLGGTPLALTTNGSGTVNFGSYIVSINTNVSYELDKPASATGSVTLSHRLLDTSIATLKGWTVTG